MKDRKSQVGFSLIQLLIAASILAALSLYFAEYTRNSIKQQKYLEMKSEVQEATNRFQFLFKNPEACTEALVSAPSDGSDILSELHFNSDHTGFSIEKGAKIIGDITLETLRVVPESVTPLGSTSNEDFLVELEVGFKKKEGNYFMSGTEFKRRIGLTVKLCEYKVYTFSSEPQKHANHDACHGEANWHLGDPGQDPAQSNEGAVGVTRCKLCGSSKPILNCVN